MTKLLEQARREVERLPEAEQDAAAGALPDDVKHIHDILRGSNSMLWLWPTTLEAALPC